ncbi:hypothetical protein ONZ45_g14855 [Pleurotus djamor]|nr:hypothetical protein ONZ45_g14855 [Pleurotus djamor]
MRFSFTAATVVAVAVAGSFVNSAIIPRRAMNLSRIESRYFNDYVEAEARDVPEVRSEQYDRGYAGSTYRARAHPRDFTRRVAAASYEEEEVEARDEQEPPVIPAYYARAHAREFIKRGQY